MNAHFQGLQQSGIYSTETREENLTKAYEHDNISNSAVNMFEPESDPKYEREEQDELPQQR